ncbi:MAG: helical backbone metal receptor [Candidatus Bathyarchaeota archaeon]
MNKNLFSIILVLSLLSLAISVYGIVNFQGQIDDLGNSVNDLKVTINDLDNEMASINEAKSTLDTLEEQIGVYQDTISEQQGLITEFQHVTLVDSLGNVIILDSPPERIVSLAPSNTEILFAVGAGENVVGVTDYCDYPYNFTEWIEAGNLTSIGSYYGPSTEPIVALEPDLVLASLSGSQDVAENLKNLGYNVLVLESKSIDGMLQDILLVGRATGNDAIAGQLVADIREKIDLITNQLEGVTDTPKVYHEIWNEPIMSAGPTTFVDELIALAGGENVFHDALTGWPVVSSEAVIAKNPDVMFFPDMYMGEGNFYDTLEAVENRPGWDSITAVQNDALYEINADIISRSGPRLVDALEAIAKMVHPEIFGNP